MKKYEVTYNDSTSVVVEAENEDQARGEAMRMKWGKSKDASGQWLGSGLHVVQIDQGEQSDALEGS